MADQYKLVYFDLNGRGEPIRWLLKLAKKEFEDERIPRQEFAQHKARFPLGTLPVLYENGVELTQTNAIGLYLSEKFGFVSKNPLLQFRSVEVTEIMADSNGGFRAWMMAPEGEQKAAALSDLLDRILPMLLKKITSILKESREKTNNSGKFIAGSQVTWGDLVLTNHLQVFSTALDNPLTSLLDEFGLVRELSEAVQALPEIKAWLAIRPKTRF